MKTLVILVDGMRPDAIENLPRVRRLLAESSYTMEATTVMPSVTLPCHIGKPALHPAHIILRTRNQTIN